MHLVSWQRVVVGGLLTLGALALHVSGCGVTGWPATPADADDPNVIKIDEKGRLQLPSNVRFKALLKIPEDATPALEALRDFLAANAEVTKLRIEGHIDNSGNPAARKVAALPRCTSATNSVRQPARHTARCGSRARPFQS